MDIRTERSIKYTYGPSPEHNDFTGKFSGEYTWDQLHEHIKDDRWGSPYVVVEAKERTVIYGDWEDADGRDCTRGH